MNNNKKKRTYVHAENNFLSPLWGDRKLADGDGECIVLKTGRRNP